jgi:hypothetical protein
MNRSWAVGVALGAAAIAAAQDAPRGGRIRWGADLEAAQAEAARVGRPLIVYFTDDD